MSISKATIADIPAITILVNLAYRGSASETGWTSEGHLIDGPRTNEEMIAEYFTQPTITILKYTDDTNTILGVVYLEVKTPVLYLGMLCVDPVRQGRGVGKALLKEAEGFALSNGCNTIDMTVIRKRTDLISWYERYGYAFNGRTEPFHDDGRFGVPKEPLELIVLEKKIG